MVDFRKGLFAVVQALQHTGVAIGRAKTQMVENVLMAEHKIARKHAPKEEVSKSEEKTIDEL